MDCLLINQHTQHCLFSLGIQVGDTYTPSGNCLDVLNEIYQNLLAEDKVSRTFRRAIHFSQGLQKDIIPLLISTNDKNIVNAVVRILACLLVPVECLLPLEIMSRTEIGRIVVFELKAFLMKSKIIFREPRGTRVILDFIKSKLTLEGPQKMIESECESINNCLLVLRNVLHIPESGRMHKNLQNCIVWNLFVQNIDQILLHLMTNENKAYWSVAIVQLIAVLYKDQHVGTLQKLLHVWFEGSLSESSEDNESNTTPDQRSASSALLTSSESTSDSSEGSGKAVGNHEGSSRVPHGSTRPPQAGITPDSAIPFGKMLTFEEPSGDRKVSGGSAIRRGHSGTSDTSGWRAWGESNNLSDHATGTSDKTNASQHHRLGNRAKGSVDLTKEAECSLAQEFSDYGYGSHAETPEAVSTSSNEEESPPTKRPFYQKPHIQKTRYCNKQPSPQEKKEVRRKKLMKKSKNTLMNIKALANHVPRDEDITHVLKEFTVGFLLMGYEPLVTALLTELLTPSSGFPIDTSHFFWLLTYFLKFASLLELDLEQVRGVLSYSVLSYLVYEGVSITEHVEQNVHIDADVKSSLRRQHLVVTAIREFILSLEAYDKLNYLSPQDREDLRKLQSLICSSSELKCLFVLMLRLYRPEVHSKQYLEDLVVTNHILLSFVEHHNKTVGIETSGSILSDHLKQFATVDVMKHYGLLLEDFQSNGEFINDCVFTMMHHIGGEMDYVASLCQPNILKTFTQIWESDFQLCEDWSDLIEYVIHRVLNIPKQCPFVDSTAITSSEDLGWSKEECENLSCYFALSSSGSDLIASIIKLFKENGVTKTRSAVLNRLLKQGEIASDQYENLLKEEEQQYAMLSSPAVAEGMPDEIVSLRELLVMDGLGCHLSFLQRVLLDTRQAKLYLQQNQEENQKINYPDEPVPFYFSLLNQSVPIVSWNCELAAALRNRTFQCLLRQLGLQSPAETGMHFFRIPSFWTPDMLLSVAQQLSPIDPSLSGSCAQPAEESSLLARPMEPREHFAMPRTKTSTSLVNYTPLPNVPTSWMDVVTKSKTVAVMDIRELDVRSVEPLGESQGHAKAGQEVEDLDCASVLSVCDTQASDLTRMCISDEDEEGTQIPEWT